MASSDMDLENGTTSTITEDNVYEYVYNDVVQPGQPVARQQISEAKYNRSMLEFVENKPDLKYTMNLMEKCIHFHLKEEREEIASMLKYADDNSIAWSDFFRNEKVIKSLEGIRKVVAFFEESANSAQINNNNNNINEEDEKAISAHSTTHSLNGKFKTLNLKKDDLKEYDIQIIGVKGVKEAIEGEPFTVEWTVKNVGKKELNEHNCTVESFINNDFASFRTVIPIIKPNEQKTILISIISVKVGKNIISYKLNAAGRSIGHHVSGSFHVKKRESKYTNQLQPQNNNNNQNQNNNNNQNQNNNINRNSNDFGSMVGWTLNSYDNAKIEVKNHFK